MTYRFTNPVFMKKSASYIAPINIVSDKSYTEDIKRAVINLKKRIRVEKSKACPDSKTLEKMLIIKGEFEILLSDLS